MRFFKPRQADSRNRTQYRPKVESLEGKLLLASVTDAPPEDTLVIRDQEAAEVADSGDMTINTRVKAPGLNIANRCETFLVKHHSAT